MKADGFYLVVGLSLLLAIVLPVMLERIAVSAPMVLVGVGFVVGLTPLLDDITLDPAAHRTLVEHVTELAVIVALMGVGLALDRPLRPQRWSSWRSWGPTWRMLAIAMPLCIAGVTLLGVWLGLGLASALLLASCLAPTDPVLASDVQVAGPQTGDEEVDEHDEVRFTLTSEAGLNDGLAFPFVYAATLLAASGAEGFPWWEWLSFYAVGKVAIGVAVGIGIGRVLAYIAFNAESRSLRVAERGESLTALATLVTAYGVAEVAQGYGFLAVFAAAMTFRTSERHHDYHAAMHDVTERLERLLTLILLLALGVALSRGLLEDLDWRSAAIGLSLILVIRPLSGLLALLGTRSGLDRGQRGVIAFFGVRGIGSAYYLAYGLGEAPELGSDWLWSTVGFTVTASVLIHGVLATPVLTRLDRRAERSEAARETA
jgi:NhaP-type Na+/H+ or K+/H+ antiporter